MVFKVQLRDVGWHLWSTTLEPLSSFLQMKLTKTQKGLAVSVAILGGIVSALGFVVEFPNRDQSFRTSLEAIQACKSWIKANETQGDLSCKADWSLGRALPTSTMMALDYDHNPPKVMRRLKWRLVTFDTSRQLKSTFLYSFLHP